MDDSAMWLYPINKRNRDKLGGFEFLEVWDSLQLKAKVFTFVDGYRKLKVDLVVSPLGGLYISDYYGESMRKENINYVYKGW